MADSLKLSGLFEIEGASYCLRGDGAVYVTQPFAGDLSDLHLVHEVELASPGIAQTRTLASAAVAMEVARVPRGAHETHLVVFRRGKRFDLGFILNGDSHRANDLPGHLDTTRHRCNVNVGQIVDVESNHDETAPGTGADKLRLERILANLLGDVLAVAAHGLPSPFFIDSRPSS